MDEFRTMYLGAIASANEAVRPRIFLRETSLIGATQEQIEGWERELDLTFPRAYSAYLSLMGCMRADLFDMADVAPQRLTERARDCAAVLAEQQLALPRDAVVFYGFNGYHFRWIRASEGDDPYVHNVVEGEPPQRTSERFSEFICLEIAARVREMTC